MATSTRTSSDQDFESVAQAYFGALADGNLAKVPYAAHVVMNAPLASERLIGRPAVEEYLRPFAGTIGEIKIREIFISTSRNAMTVEAFVGPLHVVDKFVIEGGQIVEQQNFYDPRPVLEAATPGGLTADERSLLLQRLESSRDRVRQFLEQVRDDSASRKPGLDCWTVLQNAEHLVLTEKVLFGLVRDKVLNTPANPGLTEELRAKEATLLAAMGDRSAKVKTFDFLEPQGKYPNCEAALDAFLARRAETIDFARATRAAVHHHAAPLEGLGLLDAYQWLLLIAAHTERHLEQMREAVGTGSESATA